MQQPGDFQAFIAQERERLDRQRADVLSKKADLDNELQSIEREMAAITAYERAKVGKSAASALQSARRNGRRSGRRQEVLDLLKGSPDGLSRREILERLDVKGERREEQSVSNALSALKKAGQLGQEGGKYVAA